MGQEILYCYKCQTRLMGSEFEKGKAFKVGGQAACAVCVKDLLASKPDAQIDTERRTGSSARMRPVSADGSSKVKPPTVRSAPAPAPKKSSAPLIIGVVVVGAILLLILALVMGSGSRRPDPSPPGYSGPVPPPPPPKPEDPKPPPPTSAYAAELRDIDEKMNRGFANEEFRQVSELLDAARKRRNTPEWLSEIEFRIPQLEARVRRASMPLREKAIEAQNAKDAAEVKRLRDKVASWGFASIVADFDKALSEAVAAPPKPPPPPPLPPSNEPPRILFDDALGPEVLNWSWDANIDLAATTPVFEGSRSIAITTKKASGALYFEIKGGGVDPARYRFITFALYVTEPNIPCGYHFYGDDRGGTGHFNEFGGLPKPGEWKRYVIPVAALAPKATRITGFVLQFYRAATSPLAYIDSVAFVSGPESAPPPKPAATELDAYRARWTQAATKAALRDYAGAQRELEEGSSALKEEAGKAEAAADLELLKLAAQVPVEALKLIEKWPKGQKARLEYLNANGEREATEGTLQSADAVRLSVLREGTPFELPVAELLPSTLAEIFRGRADRKPTDSRAAAAFCLFEGDAESAKKLWGDGPAIPNKLLGLAKERPAAEVAGRKLFWTAEGEFAAPKRRPAAIEKYSALAGESTPYAVRLRPYVTARLEAAKDTVFLAEDLNGAGAFSVMANAKIDAGWTSTADGSPAKAKENYVEAEFHAFPGAAYRAWIWAGACCLETFEFSVQASDLSVPNPKNSKELISYEPGGDNTQAAKAPSLTLKRWHAQHNGPKEAAKWDWFPVALPKYETAGLKKLRVLSTQQGFSVGAIVISATRRETPGEKEMKDLEKARFGIRKGVNPGPLGYILQEYWLDITGNNVEDLTKHPSFAGKPSGSSPRDSFEGLRNFAENYGTRLRGYIHPPATGAYTFWLATDDAGELWLSVDDNPARKRLIVSQPIAAGYREWTKYPHQKSAPVQLVAGKRYYVEALMKEIGTDDHCSVGWTLPDGTEEKPIPGSRLSPWGLIPPAAGPPGTTFYRAFDINGEATIIDGRKWDGKRSPQLGVSGDGLEFQNVPLTPATDDARAGMIRSFAWQKDSTVVKVNQIPPGSYQIYLYVWENDVAQVYDIFVQGKEVVKGYNSGPAGHWDKLGPWTAVIDGTLDIHTAGGDANLSGLELWKVGK